MKGSTRSLRYQRETGARHSKEDVGSSVFCISKAPRLLQVTKPLTYHTLMVFMVRPRTSRISLSFQQISEYICTGEPQLVRHKRRWNDRTSFTLFPHFLFPETTGPAGACGDKKQMRRNKFSVQITQSISPGYPFTPPPAGLTSARKYQIW